MPRLAAATTLADLQTRGFHIVASTKIDGHFTGCVKSLSWPLADGSMFLCRDSWRADAFNPAALLLHSDADRTYVLLIRGHAYSASLLRIRGRALASPIALDPVADDPPLAPSLEPIDDRVSPTEPVNSINELRDRDRLDLETAQRFRPYKAEPLPK